MRSATAILTVKLLGDNQTSKAFRDAQAKVEQFEAGMDRASVAATAGLAAIGAGAWKAVDAASNLQQSAGAVESVFGGAAATIENFAATSSQSVGISSREFNELSAVAGAMLQNLGFDSEAAASKTIELTERAADLAAVFGGEASAAMDAMSAALRGEFDPLEQFGIKLSAAALEEKALAMGLAASASELDGNAKAQAALALIMEQSASSAGMFASEADTVAVQQQKMRAQMEETTAQLGEALLPVMSMLIEHLADAATWVGENVGLVTAVAGALAGMASAVLLVNGAYRTYNALVAAASGAKLLFNSRLGMAVRLMLLEGGALLKSAAAAAIRTGAEVAGNAARAIGQGITMALAAANAVLNAILLMNPIALVVVAVLALIAVFVVLWVKCEAFREAVKRVWEVLKNAFLTVLDAVRNALSTVWEWVKKVGDFIGGVFRGAWDALRGAIDWVRGAFDSVVGAIRSVWDWMKRLMDRAGELIGALNPLKALGGLFGGGGRSLVTGSGAMSAGVSSVTITTRAHGYNPQRDAEDLARLLTGARVRTGFRGVRVA